MRIIIDSEGIKREVLGEFTICVDRKTLIALQSSISVIESNEWTYGWIDIRPPMPPGTKNSKPISWNATAPQPSEPANPKLD